MRRLFGFLLLTIAMLIVLTALLISGLRLLLPQLDYFRPQIVTNIEQVAGVSVQLGRLEGSWQSFGPTLEIRDLSFAVDDMRWKVARITVALDVWQSLLRLRWQFRDLTFYRLWIDSDQMLDLNKRGGSDIKPDRLSDVFLYQFDRFILRDSRISFLSPSGAPITLDIPQLTWLNSAIRHRAEGNISLSTLGEQRGNLQVRMDLRDDNGLLSDGQVYFQADSIDVTPWLSRWVSQQTGLDSAAFSLAAWLTIKNREVIGGDMLLRHGKATWVEKSSRFDCAPRWYTQRISEQENSTYGGLVPRAVNARQSVRKLPLWALLSAQVRCPMVGRATMRQYLFRTLPYTTEQYTQQHDLTVDNLTLHVARMAYGWQFDIPRLNLTTDGNPWAQGLLSILYLPENSRLLEPKQEEELRIRATRLQLTQLGEILPTFAFLTPEIKRYWNNLQPRGYIPRLALDIPLNRPEKTRIMVDWQNVGWNHWNLLPGMENFSGSASGSVMNTRLSFALAEASIPYGDMFRVPLEIRQAHGNVDWRNDEDGWTLSGQGLDVQARSLWVNGDFSFHQPQRGEPWLSILAGIRLNDARDAWRYFPEPLMTTPLTDYLSEALEGGKVDNATLVYAGNPHNFPYQRRDGLFEVFVPLRDATFRFQPDWEPLTDLAINLDFINDGLWMRAPSAKLNKVAAKNINANIPVYLDKKLLIDANIIGEGAAVYDYFNQSPLKGTVGNTLASLQIGGNVDGRLHLNIPLHANAQTHASGEVILADNTLLIKPINSTLEKVTGRFRFDNDSLKSSSVKATLYDQPINLQFSTQPGVQDYRVNVVVNGNWQPSRLPGIPAEMARQFEGSAPWNSKVDVILPYHGTARYQIQLNADLKEISSQLPVPLMKSKGEAMPLEVRAQGDMDSVMLSGSVNENNGFNSLWLLRTHGAKLDRAVWRNGSATLPALPEDGSIALSLPALDGGAWLALLSATFSQGESGSNFNYPQRMILTVPMMQLAGQRWNNLRLEMNRDPNMIRWNMKGQEVDGSAVLGQDNILRTNIAYLYYNPQWPAVQESSKGFVRPPWQPASRAVSFHNWPTMLLRCRDCWVIGQRLHKVAADLRPQDDTLRLENGLIDTGNTRLDIAGVWRQNGNNNSTTLKGKLYGANISNSIDYFGITTPLKQAPFDIDFDLNWQGFPWQPQVESLNGKLDSKLGKGEITNVGGGRAGQLLRLVSFDALLRKLRLDFSDTFSSNFPFDSIRGTARVERGVITTQNTLVDGLAADIAMNGKIDLVRRKIDMETVVAPEISATVGVATAFVVNPVVGAAFFAASKVLSPLWNKISLIRYHITGNLDHPAINEILRQPKGEKTP